MLWNGFELLVNLFQIVIIIQTLTVYLGARYKGWKKYGLEAIAIITVFIELSYINSVIPFEGLAIIFPILLIFIYTMAALYGSWKKKLFLSIMIMVMVIGVTVIVMNLTGMIFGKTYMQLILHQNAIRFTAVIIIQIVIFYITRIFLLKNNKDDVNLSWDVWMIMLMLPCISILILSLIVELTLNIQPEFQEGATEIAFIASLGILIIDVFAYFMYIKLKKDAAEKMEYEVLKQRYNMQEKNMGDLKLLYASLQKTKHDVKHHMNLLKMLLEKKEHEEALKYLQEYSDSVYSDNKNVVLCDNVVVSYIINVKTQIMKQKNIRFYCDICDRIQGVSDVDINIILGNLLDNAIEACERYSGKEKEIVLSIYKKASYLIISVKNTVDETLEDINFSGTSKKDKNRHGYGILSVRDVAEKYNGHMNIKHKDNKVEITCSIDIDR